MKINRLLAVFLSVSLAASALAFSVTQAAAYDDYEYPIVNFTEDPTGHCTEEDVCEVSAFSNYCDVEPETQIIPTWEQATFDFIAPENLEIVSFQFRLTRDEEYLSLESYSSFAPQMSYNDKESGDRILLGNVSSLDPISVKAGETLVSATIACSYPNSANIFLTIEDLQVRTPYGDLVIVQNGEYIERLVGDVNQNKAVDIGDATTLQKHIAEYTIDGAPVIDETDPKTMYIADVDRDHSITIKDVTLIQQYLAEYIRSFE